MAQKKKLESKHISRKMTSEQEEAIGKISKDKGVPWVQAKHEFFEAWDKENHASPVKKMPEKSLKKPVSKEPAKKMTVKETKLGVTMVLNHEDCRSLGFKDSLTTSEVIREVRNKLGLPEKHKKVAS